MMSSESSLSLDFDSERINSLINCDFCNSKINDNSAYVEISFKLINVTQNNNDVLNDPNNYLNFHTKCHEYSFYNLNNFNASNQNNKKYFTKYWYNVKKNYLLIFTLFIFLMLITSVALYNCYSIISTENYMGEQNGHYYNCSSYLTEWIYDVHILTIINVLIQCVTCFAICFKLILLIFL